MLDRDGIIRVLRLITGASRLTHPRSCYTISAPVVTACDESKQPSHHVAAGILLPAISGGHLMVELVCRFCAKPFMVYPCKSARRSCSIRCRQDDKNGPLSDTRTCTKCNATFPATLDYFDNVKGGKQGLSTQCIPCRRKVTREYNRAHKEEQKGWVKKWRMSKPEDVKKAKHNSYLRHRSHVIAKSREYRRNNPDYWRISPEKDRAKGAKRRALKLGSDQHYTAADVRALLQQQQATCFYCKTSIAGGYHVDHYIPLSRGGSNAASNIVLACASCNFRKGDRMPEDFIQWYLERRDLPL